MSRLDRMQDALYDDKMSEVITIEKYESKRADINAKRADLQARLAAIDMTLAHQLTQRIGILQLTQKAGILYETMTNEQKRFIIFKLFKELTLHTGILSVSYTKFVEAIAVKVQKTDQLLKEAK